MHSFPEGSSKRGGVYQVKHEPSFAAQYGDKKVPMLPNNRGYHYWKCCKCKNEMKHDGNDKCTMAMHAGEGEANVGFAGAQLGFKLPIKRNAACPHSRCANCQTSWDGTDFDKVPGGGCCVVC